VGNMEDRLLILLDLDKILSSTRILNVNALASETAAETTT